MDPATTPAARRRLGSGSFLVIVSAVAFGFLPLFERWAREDGVTSATVLFLRFAVAGPVLGTILLARGGRWPRGTTLALLVAMGAVGYFGQSYCYFSALRYLPAGLVALLLYLYPVIVGVLSRLVFGEPLTGRRVLAFVLALTGTVLMLGPSAWGSADAGLPTVGILLGLGSAVIYALYVLAGARVGRDTGALESATVVALAAAASFGVAAVAGGGDLPRTPLGWTGIGCLAVVSTIVAVTAFLAGLDRVGPVRASTLSALEPGVAVAVGVLLLSDPFSIVQLAGGVLVLTGAVLAARAPEGVRSRPGGEVFTGR